MVFRLDTQINHSGSERDWIPKGEFTKFNKKIDKDLKNVVDRAYSDPADEQLSEDE